MRQADQHILKANPGKRSSGQSQPVATHCHWALRNCDQDPEKLKKLLLNTVEHYKDNHSDCHSSSRRSLDKNYRLERKKHP